MQHAQNDDSISLYLIRDNVRQPRDHQFTGALYSPRPPHTGVLSEIHNGRLDVLKDAERSPGIVFQDVIEDGVKVLSS